MGDRQGREPSDRRQEKELMSFLSWSLQKELLHLPACFMWEAGLHNEYIPSNYHFCDQASNSNNWISQNWSTIKDLSYKHSALPSLFYTASPYWKPDTPFKEIFLGDLKHVIYLLQLQLCVSMSNFETQFWVCYSLQITIRDTQTVSSIKARLKKYVASRF